MRNSEAECIGCLEIDSELDFCKQLDRQVGGLLPVENAPGIYANKVLTFGKARTVGDKTAGQRLFDVRVHCRDRMASRQRDELIRPTYKENIAANQERASMPLDQGQEGSLDLALLLAFSTTRSTPRTFAANCISLVSASA